MNFSTISRFTIALVLGAMATSTLAAADTSYIGPKGGDSRKGVYANPPSTHEYTSGYVASVEPYGFIGPKGGDSRKGIYGGTCMPCATEPARTSVAMDRQSDVGPKGGSSSKFQYRRSL